MRPSDGIDANCVHIWQASVPCLALLLNPMLGTLSLDERDRAHRFYFEKDRQRYTVARGLLRVLLGDALRIKPSELRFCYGPHGKPGLAFASDIRFNLSHSHDIVMIIAIGRSREVGVDVEWIGRPSGIDGIAELYFSHSEQQALACLPEESRRRAFFACWTRKEAYVKARGDGLARPFDSFSVPLDKRLPEGACVDTGAWMLHDIESEAQDYASAVAAAGTDWRPKVHVLKLDELKSLMRD